jgi:hypothetical protein
MTQTKRFLVYVASNHQGLESERYEVTRQLARMGILSCGFPCREDTSPYDWNLARSQIEDADLFIMILGDDYGPMAPTGISYLHREMVHAQSLSKPIISFVKNSLPSQQQTEDQRRLAGFHGVVSKGNYRLWHLREELISHVKTAVVNALSNKPGGWLKLDSVEDSLSDAPKETQPVVKASNKVDAKQWLLKTRQLIRLQFSAKVYEAGNNTLEELAVSQRWDALFVCAGSIMKSPSSEDRLRVGIEKLVSEEVKRRLLQQHPSAHAVDDIRINRQQFQQLLDQWLQDDLVSKQLKGGRSAWQLTAEGVRRMVSMASSRQPV